MAWACDPGYRQARRAALRAAEADAERRRLELADAARRPAMSFEAIDKMAARDRRRWHRRREAEREAGGPLGAVS